MPYSKVGNTESRDSMSPDLSGDLPIVCLFLFHSGKMIDFLTKISPENREIV